MDEIEVAAVKPTVTLEMLQAIDVRVGTIERKQALFVVNLEPKEMMGEISEGMLFDIGYADGITPVLAVPESAVPNGVRVG